MRHEFVEPEFMEPRGGFVPVEVGNRIEWRPRFEREEGNEMSKRFKWYVPQNADLMGSSKKGSNQLLCVEGENVWLITTSGKGIVVERTEAKAVQLSILLAGWHDTNMGYLDMVSALMEKMDEERLSQPVAST